MAVGSDCVFVDVEVLVSGRPGCRVMTVCVGVRGGQSSVTYIVTQECLFTA